MASVESATHPVTQIQNTAPQPRRRGLPNQAANNPESIPPFPRPDGSTASLALRPASIAPSPNIPSTNSSGADASATENGNSGGARSRGSRGRGRGRGIGGGREVRSGEMSTSGHGRNTNKRGHDRLAESNGHHGTAGTGRPFGGTLTQEEASSAPQTSTLQADAPGFHPGKQLQPLPARTRGGNTSNQSGNRPPRVRAPRARRQSLSKSTASDIATRTHEDIANGVYECAICTNEIVRNSKVWSCNICWSVFHLSCIKKWATNEGSTQAQQRSEGDLPPPRQWRCPGCNLPKDVLPSNFTCWCKKEADPQPVSGIPPMSCGQTCGSRRVLPKPCPHACESICHAGPCKPCTHMGPIISCFCGKKTSSKRCVETDYATGFNCGSICGDILPCGEHTCQRLCHEGLCGACDVQVDAQCYCGKLKQSIACCERGYEKESRRAVKSNVGPGIVDKWIGTFHCGNSCRRAFDCGTHHCEKPCHPQELMVPHCPRSPDMVTHCPCGKTSLADMSILRRTCEEPIPSCAKLCLKKLTCGHLCQGICHAEECPPCLQVTNVSCRCNRTTSRTVCHQGNEERPQCMRICRATLNCGRHDCLERCCASEKKAMERQATKRKLRPLGASRVADEVFETEHICMRLCERTLKCSNHTCSSLCHRGPCPSCQEAIFDEISCNCGSTTLQPPLPCGTKPPQCRFDCQRPTNCGHPRIPHSCHGDEERCPNCPFLAQKSCLCGKNSLKNQPCWLSEVRCGEVCGRQLKCGGAHFCTLPCHRPGECEDVGKSCPQRCGKAKKCGCICEEPCHAPSSCREDKPCQNKIIITCDCQHLKQEVKCNASKTSEGNRIETLVCDDECARLARNRNLALALNIDPEAHKDDHIPYCLETLKMFRENTRWAQIQEREIRVFATEESEKRLRFKPMPSHQRAFIHSLSKDLGFDSESMDPEPFRHVSIFKTPRFVMAPMKTLAECVRIRRSAAAPTATVTETQRKVQASNETYNGFLLSNPRFGLTLEELRADIAGHLDTSPGLAYDISFLPSEEIAIKARPVLASTVISSSAIATAIRALKPSLSLTTSSKGLATSIQLCALDSSLNVIRREIDDDPARNGGWSQVAAKAAAPRFAPRQTAVGEQSVYTVLGSKLRDAKRKKAEMKKATEEEAVVDDWEEEVKKLEEEEEKAKNGALGEDVGLEGGKDGGIAEGESLQVGEGGLEKC